MKLSELIEQLKILLDCDGDLETFILHKTPQGDVLENPFPTVLDVTTSWKRVCKELEYYKTGDLLVIL